MKDAGTIEIRLGERPVRVAQGMTLHRLRQDHKPDADVIILNGFPVREDRPLAPGDAVVLIRRGKVPDPQELEALMMARHTPGVHAAVRRAVVGIAGLGGLGSAVAIALARVGVGKLVIADFDVVEPSNLNRQQYFVDQIGMRKVEAMAANLARINPAVTVEKQDVLLAPGNIAEIFRDVDVLVEAFDDAEAKALLVESFSQAFPDRPIVTASGLAGHLSSNMIKTRRVGRSLVVVGDGITASAPGAGLMAPRVGVAAHHQANAVLRILLGEDPAG